MLKIRKGALQNYLKELIEDGSIKDFIIEKIEANHIGPELTDKDECDLENQIDDFLEEVTLAIENLE